MDHDVVQASTVLNGRGHEVFKTDEEEARPSGEDDDCDKDEKLTTEERRGRQLARAGSFKRRDASWDQKWQAHLDKNTEEVPRSSVFAKRQRVPGKINCSAWETRAASNEQRRQNSLPPKTPPPAKRRFAVRESTDSPKPRLPHHGANVLDYSSPSPARVDTPPYPSTPLNTNTENCEKQHTISSNTRTDVELLPPPPATNAEKLDELDDLKKEQPLPPPPSFLQQEDTNLGKQNETEGWKSKTQINQPIEVATKDESKVQSALLDFDAPNLKVKSPSPLSRSVSGTFQAVPAIIIPAEEESLQQSFSHQMTASQESQWQQTQESSQTFVATGQMSSETVTQKESKTEQFYHSMHKSEALHTTMETTTKQDVAKYEDEKKSAEIHENNLMLEERKVKEDMRKRAQKKRQDDLKKKTVVTSDTKKSAKQPYIEEQTRHLKTNLMAQIKSDVPKTPAVGDTFGSTQHACKPDITASQVVKMPSISSTQHEPDNATSEVKPSTSSPKPQEKVIGGTKGITSSPEPQEKVIGDTKGMKIKYAVTDTSMIERTKDVQLKMHSQQQTQEIMQEDEVGEVQLQENNAQEEHDLERPLEEEKVKDTSNETSEFVVKRPKKPQEVISTTTPKQDLSHRPTTPNRLYMFESAPKERIFSISGMWTNVQLGLVKERSGLWQKQGPTRRPNYQANSSKRRSRIIDPNTWVQEPMVAAENNTQQKELHKSMSTGSLHGSADSESKEPDMVMSNAVAAWEQRPNGRKSADIFVSTPKQKSCHSTKETSQFLEEEVEIKEVVNLQETLESHEEIVSKERKEEKQASQQVEFATNVQESIINTVSKVENCVESVQQMTSTEVKQSDSITVVQETVTESSKCQTANERSPEAVEQIKSEEEITKHDEVLAEMTFPKAPEVPGRSSSKKVVKEKLQQKQRQQTTTPPILKLLSVTVTPSSSPVTAAQKDTSPKVLEESSRLSRELELQEQQRLEQNEWEKKQRYQQEQEKRFHERMEIERKLRERQERERAKWAAAKQHQHSSGQVRTIIPQPPIPPPPREGVTSRSDSREIERIRSQELKELMKLKEMERRKREIEEEIAKEKQHLAELQMLEERRIYAIEEEKFVKAKKPKAVEQYEAMVSEKMGPTSPEPPPVPPPPAGMAKPKPLDMTQQSNKPEEIAKPITQSIQPTVDKSSIANNKSDGPLKVDELRRLLEMKERELEMQKELAQLQSLNYGRDSPVVLSYADTVKELEVTTKQLKELAEQRGGDPSPKLTTTSSNSKEKRYSSDEVREAAGAVREVAQALLKALTPDDQVQDPSQIPQGVVGTAKSSLQRQDSDRNNRQTAEVAEELKGIGAASKVKETTPIFATSKESLRPPPSPRTARRMQLRVTDSYSGCSKKTDSDEEDTDGYSEGCEDFSSGIELPISMMGGNEQSSGNVTPIPTQGELEEISVEELNVSCSMAPPSPPRTPLKSLLKKQSFDAADETYCPGCDNLSVGTSDTMSHFDRSSSPKKAVHFSEIDQVKLMSQESLVSTAPSDASTAESLTPVAVCTLQMSSCSPNYGHSCNGSTTNMPRRNQTAAPTSYINQGTM